jgi:hypothetical protein
MVSNSCGQITDQQQPLAKQRGTVATRHRLPLLGILCKAIGCGGWMRITARVSRRRR